MQAASCSGRPAHPVVPIAIQGSSRIRNWKRLRFPRGHGCSFGEAMRWEVIEQPTPAQQQAVADQVLRAIRVMNTGLEQHGRKGVLRSVRAQRRSAKTPAVA